MLATKLDAQSLVLASFIKLLLYSDRTPVWFDKVHKNHWPVARVVHMLYSFKRSVTLHLNECNCNVPSLNDIGQTVLQ
jgi:hypothetical protein